MLQSFAKVASEVEDTVLVLEWDNPDREQLIRVARELNIADAIRCVGSDERAQAIGCADVVIAPATGSNVNDGMLQAMAAGRAVIAADVPENRECSADGRGCVWFKPEDDLDLVHRTAFVARNREFARSLGESGRAHIATHRAAGIVGKQYDQVYRHAHSRRSESNIPKVEMPKIYALGRQMF
jgi:glycosyltransferase involved in cell wall biosynthesis